MTDEHGRYLIEAPVGAHEVKAFMIGYVAGSEHIRLGLGDTANVDFALEKNPHEDDMIKSIRTHAVTGHDTPMVQVEELRLGEYLASTEPVLWESLKFEFRYVLAQQDDSVIVNVVAEGKNMTATPFTVCGHFAFWSVAFLPSPEVYAEIIRLGGRTHYEGPILEVSGDKFVPGALECETVELGPGESIARGMTFSFDPEEFAYWTGEVGIQCYFFAGNNGDAWPDVKRIGLGMVRIPIRPIGQTVRPPR
jgi:hypothetical protein